MIDPGIYLSTYVAPPGLPAALRLRPRHDQNVAIWNVGPDDRVELVRHWELERLSGAKHHSTSLPTVSAARRMIGDLLAADGLSWRDVQGSWGTPGLDFGPGYRSPDPRFSVHTIAHLYTALLRDSDEFAESDILAFAADGGPDHMLGRTRHLYAGALSRRGETRFFPVESPGRLFDSARQLYGLEAGSLMALASAAETRVDAETSALLAGRRFSDHVPGAADVFAESDKVVREVHALVESRVDDADCDTRFTRTERVTSAAMKVVQELAAGIMRRNIDSAIAEFDLDPASTVLGLAGGFALNCPTNSYLLASYGFRAFSAPPCANDSGQAIGVGLMALHAKLGSRMRYVFPGPYLGGDGGDLREALAEWSGSIESTLDSTEHIVADLAEGPVAWFEGRSEIGPRALAHRSLLSDPRSSPARDALNRMKRRQWWRPVAPVVLEHRMSDWFEGASSSPYMLRTFTVRPERRSAIPAVIHLDGTARCQTVTPASHAVLCEVLERFEQASGVPMLGNTSLNDRGEPIVQTLSEALRFCVRRGVRTCYLDGIRVALRESEPDDGPAPLRQLGSEPLTKTEALALARDLNPHQLSDPELYYVLTMPSLQDTLDIRTRAGADLVQRQARAHYSRHPQELAWVAAFLARVQTA